MRTFIENYLHFMKNCIRPPYKKLKTLKSGFIENSNFENNRDPWSRGKGKMFHRIGSDIWWVLWWFVMQTRWSWVCMRPRDLLRGPRGLMGGPGGASGSRRASRGSHGAIREVRRVFWWFMRHVCLYILWSRFFLRVRNSIRGSTRGPRGPKKWCSEVYLHSKKHFPQFTAE